MRERTTQHGYPETKEQVLKKLSDYRQHAYRSAKFYVEKYMQHGERDDLAAAKFWSREEDEYDNLICILEGNHPLSNEEPT